MKPGLKRYLLAVGIFAACLFLAGSAVLLFFGRSFPSALPNPNGYDDIVQASQAALGTMDGVATLDSDSLRTLVTDNAEALRILRMGLSRSSVVPTELAIANSTTMYRELGAFKTLSRLLLAEGRLAELENRPDDAARSYLDAMKLGDAISHGGFLIHRLVGIACESIGRGALLKLLPHLSCDPIRPLVKQLDELDEHGVTWAEVSRNENRFARAQVGKIGNPLKLVTFWWAARPMRRTAKQRHDVAVAQRRLLTVELALRCYRSEHGTVPASLQQLVPKQLQGVPKDPFSGKQILYKSTGTNWLLYSVGPDEADDGGRPVAKLQFTDPFLNPSSSNAPNAPKNSGDLFLDSL